MRFSSSQDCSIIGPPLWDKLIPLSGNYGPEQMWSEARSETLAKKKVANLVVGVLVEAGVERVLHWPATR